MKLYMFGGGQPCQSQKPMYGKCWQLEAGMPEELQTMAGSNEHHANSQLKIDKYCKEMASNYCQQLDVSNMEYDDDNGQQVAKANWENII